jgi:hypothetical protein
VLQIAFDMDERNPQARVDDFGDELGEPYFRQHSIALRKGEQLVCDVRPLARELACEYSIAINLLVAGKRTTQRIDDEGKPFKVSGLHEVPAADGSSETDFNRYPQLFVEGSYSPDGRFVETDPQTYDPGLHGRNPRPHRQCLPIGMSCGRHQSTDQCRPGAAMLPDIARRHWRTP